MFMWMPTWVMHRWSYYYAFVLAVDGTPITFANAATIDNGGFVECLQLFVLHWFVLLFLTIYCNYVLPSAGNGSTAPWYFCLLPKYWKQWLSWLPKQAKQATAPGAAVDLNVLNPASDDVIPEILKQGNWFRPKDAEAEHHRVITKPFDQEKGTPHIRVINLHKTFPSKGGAPPKVAVRCVSMGVDRGECFGLLGHNGAGKTTAINMLTGLYSMTSGVSSVGRMNGWFGRFLVDPFFAFFCFLLLLCFFVQNAYVGKFSIKDDLSKIYSDMGVCPQHDLLWPDLYAKEHLDFYGRLKGFSGKKLDNMVASMLKKVNLTKFAKRTAGGFSGGMKRRLSMANALMGGPGVVYMDEPSTGLDPASKHALWDVIAAAKSQGGRSMLLTTHSMEEADGTWC
jgi:ABC-type multidrug transport system ATPase subunit